MREKFRRFMIGRYGTDALSQFLLYAALVCILLSFFFHSGWWNLIILALFVISYFRIFSKNHAKRYEENQKFLALTARARSWASGKRYQLSQMKDYHIYTCPTCRQKIRIPRGKGKIMVRCPKCHTGFMKKS